jgi:hypothetical protein
MVLRRKLDNLGEIEKIADGITGITGTNARAGGVDRQAIDADGTCERLLLPTLLIPTTSLFWKSGSKSPK